MGQSSLPLSEPRAPVARVNERLRRDVRQSHCSVAGFAGANPRRTPMSFPRSQRPIVSGPTVLAARPSLLATPCDASRRPLGIKRGPHAIASRIAGATPAPVRCQRALVCGGGSPRLSRAVASRCLLPTLRPMPNPTPVRRERESKQTAGHRPIRQLVPSMVTGGLIGPGLSRFRAAQRRGRPPRHPAHTCRHTPMPDVARGDRSPRSAVWRLRGIRRCISLQHAAS